MNVSLRVTLQNKGTHLPLPLETQKVDRSEVFFREITSNIKYVCLKKIWCSSFLSSFIEYQSFRWPIRTFAECIFVQFTLTVSRLNYRHFWSTLPCLRLIWAATWQNQQSDCAPSEVSDQPGHPPILIWVFAVRMKKHWTLSYPLSVSEDSDQTGRMPRLIWVFAGRIVTLLVLSWGGSFAVFRCHVTAFYCFCETVIFYLKLNIKRDRRIRILFKALLNIIWSFAWCNCLWSTLKFVLEFLGVRESLEMRLKEI